MNLYLSSHGGNEASKFAKEHLMNHIVNLKGFWSDDDEDVKKAIREGFLSTHHAMWKDLGKLMLTCYTSSKFPAI